MLRGEADDGRLAPHPPVVRHHAQRPPDQPADITGAEPGPVQGQGGRPAVPVLRHQRGELRVHHSNTAHLRPRQQDKAGGASEQLSLYQEPPGAKQKVMLQRKTAHVWT